MDPIVRSKIYSCVVDLLLEEKKKGNPIPVDVRNWVLEHYDESFASFYKLPGKSSPQEIEDFMMKLQPFMEARYENVKVKPKRKTTPSSHHVEFFTNAYEKLKTVKKEYENVLEDTVSICHDLVLVKTKYAEHWKNLGSQELIELEIIEKKVECVKIQLLTKQLTELDVTPQAHVVLCDILKKKQEETEKKLCEMREMKASYDKLASNKEYTELVQAHNQALKRIEDLSYLLS